MIEIFNFIIFYYSLIFLFFSKIFVNNIYNSQFSIFESAINNIIIFINVALIFSFFISGISYLLYLSIIIIILNLIKNFKLFSGIYFLLLLLVIYSLSTVIISDPTLGWDGQRDWYSKTFNFYKNLNFSNLKNFSYSHYPHLGTFLWAFFWKFNFLNYEYLGRIFFIFFYCLVILCLCIDKKKKVKELLVFITLIVLTFNDFLFRGYQEYLIFTLLVYFTKLLQKKNLNELPLLLLIILIFNSLIWIKNEGIVFGFIILITTCYFKKELSIQNKFLLLVSCLILTTIKYYIFDNFAILGTKTGVFAFDSIKVELFNFKTIFTDLALILKFIFMSFFQYPVFLLCFLYIAISIISKKDLENVKIIIYFLILSFALIIFIYHFSPTDMLEWHLSSSLDRLSFQASGFVVYFVHKGLIQMFDKR